MVQWKNRWWEKESLWEKESTYQTLLLVFYSSCGGISDDDPVVVVKDLCFLSRCKHADCIELETLNFNHQNREISVWVEKCKYQKIPILCTKAFTHLHRTSYNKSTSSSPSLKHIYLELQVYFSTHIGPPFPQRLPCSQVLLQQGWWMKHRLP